MAHKVLLVEDEQALGGIIKDSFESRGFEVLHVTDGGQAHSAYLSYQPDILILDVMLPNLDGLQVAANIRLENKHTPILFLTARTMPDDVLNGFKAGGNDYLKKPFDMEELIVRAQVLLNQNRLFEQDAGTAKPAMVDIGEYTYDTMRRVLSHQGQTRKLTAREGEALLTLYTYRNRLLPRKVFLIQVWGDDDLFSSRSLDVYISRLRRYLKKDPMVQIINNRGFGYKLIC